MTALTPHIRVLQAAKAIVASGWCQRAFQIIDENGAQTFCPLGALIKASHNGCRKLDQAISALATQIAIDFPEIASRVALAVKSQDQQINIIAAFNDAPERLHEEVLSIFSRTIDRLTSTILPRVSG